MKKKLICGILALGMCFSFASCDKINGILGGILGGDSSENTPLTSSSAEEVNLEEIKEYAELTIRSILSKTSNREDYTLPNTLSYDIYTYNLSWSVNVTEGVQLVKKENGTLVDVDETLSEELKYTLTVTITDSADASKSITTTFNRKVEAAPTLVPLPITKDPVVGTAYKYHIYHAQAQTDYYMTGKIYKTYEYYFDISTKMEDAVDVFVEAVEGESGKFYMYHNGPDGNAKKYINARKTADGKHISNYFEDTAETKWFFDAEVGTMVTVINNLKGVDAKYYVGCDTDPSHKSLSPQAASEDGNKGYLIEMVDRTQATVDQKLEQTAKELSLDVVYVGAGSLDLAKQGSTYPDVTVAWAVKSGDIATIADYKLTVANAPTATSEVVVTATATVDGKSVEKEFTVKFIPNETIAILDALDGLKSGESFANKVTLTGIVSAFDENGAYNEQYGNISITMMVAYNETYKEVGCFRLNGVGVENVGVGDTITVEGILTNHGGYAKQFGAGSTMTNRVDGEPSDVPGAGETPDEPETYETLTIPEVLAHEVTDTKFYVSGKITGYYGDNYATYGNVYIQDEEGNELLVYGLFSADGSTRYDAMETKPVIGDTIKVLSVISSYNNVNQLKNAWLIEHTPGSGGETPDTPDEPDTPIENALATFEFGDNVDVSDKDDDKKHNDGSAISEGTEYTSGNYTLTLTGVSKVYGGANDKTGISCLKIGTGSLVGTFTFQVPDDVKSVAFKVAMYKAKATTVTVNGKEYSITTSSNDGAYTTITINTATTKTITFATVSGTTRAMIDSIAFIATEGGDVIIPDEGGDEPVVPPTFTPITAAPVAGVEYTFYASDDSNAYYFAGYTSGYYCNATTDATQAVTVYAEPVEDSEGSFYLYYLDSENTKQYIVTYASGTYVNNKIVTDVAEATAYYFNTEYNAIMIDLLETSYFFCFYSNSWRASKVTYITSSPVAHLQVKA